MPIPRPDRYAFPVLSKVPDMDTVSDQLRAGVSCEAVAEYLQDLVGVACHSPQSALVNELYRYRDMIPLAERTVRAPSALDRAVERMPHRVSVLSESTKLYQFQLTRIADLIEEGSGGNRLGPEVDRAARLLSLVSDVKEGLGLRDDDRGDIAPSGTSQAGGALMALMVQYGPDAERRLANVGRKIHEALMRPAQQPEVTANRLRREECSPENSGAAS
jgi:hypothetical protein